MARFRMGRVVFDDRGYRVTEMLEARQERELACGFSLIGPEASSSIIYSSCQEALEALRDIEERRSAPPRAASGG